MKRPMLVSGSAIGLSSAFLVLFGMGALPFMLLSAASVFVIYFIKPFKLREKIIIPTICISVLVSCLFFGIYYFTKLVPATKFDNTITDISGTIITTPQKTPYGTKFILKTDKTGNSNQSTKIQVLLNNENEIDYKLYDYISVPNAKVNIVRNEYNKPDTSSISDNIILEAKAKSCSRLWESDKTPYYYCLRFKEIITEQINAYLSEYNSGVLLGMLFGDKAQLDADITNDFRATGIAHLLAVSGLHTSTWCAYIILFLKLFKVKEKARNIFCLLFLVLLCIVSAFTPSVMRASIMMAVVLFAPFFNERQDSLNSLGFSVAVLVLHNPYIITSTSFLLSVSATAGVLSALFFYEKIQYKLLKIKFTAIRITSEYLLNNLITAAFTGFLTLPFATYFFGVFSTVSPLTNILCIKPAFWSLLSGVVATAVSFIPQNTPQLISIFIFKISNLLAGFVTETANALESFTFCSLPIRKEYFVSGIIFIGVIALFYFGILKTSKTKTKNLIAVSLCLIIFASSILIPCSQITAPTLYITDVENGINITLRHGLKYAHFNFGSSDSSADLKYMPVAKCELLDFLYIGKADKTTNKVTKALFSYKPKTTIITEFTKNNLSQGIAELPQNTIIADSYTYNFNDEITFQIVDTSPVSCVIIKYNENTVLISYGNNNLKSLFKTYGKPDVLILSEYLPEQLPEDIEALIISSDSKIISNTNLPSLRSQCKNFRTTAEDGDIKILV